MQNTASVPTDQFTDLLDRLPADLDLDRLALETKAIQRKRKIGDGASLLRLALARGPGGFSLRQTSVACDRAIEAMMTSRDAIEIERGGVLIRALNCSGGHRFGPDGRFKSLADTSDVAAR